MNNEIEIPKILVQQQEFCLKISQNNFKVFTHVEYLRGLVTNIHQMYSQLCKRLIYVTDDYERKILNTVKVKSAHSQVILQFIKSISLQHFSISNQLNSNSVTLGTKTHRIARNRFENLKERLVHCYEICKEYLSEITNFNSQEKVFNQKCENFKDYEKDVLKYYSIKENVQTSDKLQIQEMKLKQSQQYIFRRRQDFQAQIHEVRAGLKDYFQLQKNIIAQYSRLLLNIRKVNRQSGQVYAQPILQLSNEPSQSHISNTNQDDIMPTKRSEKIPVEKTTTQIRKQIVKEQQRIVILQTFLQQFINEFQETLKVAAERIDQLRSSKQYQKFSNDKLVMSEILSYESIREIDLIVNEISLFRIILLNLNTIFGKMKVIREISKYRISNFDKFVDDTQQFVDEEKKGALSLAQKEIFRKYQKKFIDRNTQLTSRYRQRIVELQDSILNQYKREDIAYEERNKKIFKNDLFQKAYYQIVMSNFFLNRSEPISYRENPYLKKIKNHLSANQVQKIITLQGFSRPIKYKPRKNCCGGLFQWGNGVEQGLQVLTEYHCALKDGYMLIQGKMKLYEHHVGFSSQFNPKTLFGYTDIRIPKWDIYQIVLGKHLLSVKITLETTHGNIEFTNFMTMEDPYQKLMEFYDTKKNVGSIVHKDNQVDSQLIQLQQRFQSDFQAQLLKVRIIIDTLSTYLSEDKQKLSISIEYHENGSSCHAMFEIKIVQKTTVTDYYFIHDRQSNNNEIKALIESVSKKLINTKDSQLTSNINNKGKEKQLSFSIIEGNQKNKLSFQREPSFINIKGPQNILEDINLEEMKISQLQLGPLLTSRILSGIETSRNYDVDTKMTTQNRLSQKQHQNGSDIIPKIEFTPKKDEEQLPWIGQAESYSICRSKKRIRNNSSDTNNYGVRAEDNKQKISYTKVVSTKSSKSGNTQKYQTIFYVILILFLLNLILNWIGK